ncbi:MAG TPA: cell division protein FtsK, partial [Mycobacterium sp.]|nr:cell division protein FtsK [Mycobacterium sp.]
LRMTEATQTAMALGQGAREAGAECDLIADTTPGVGYVMIDGTAEPQRVRAFYVTDADITDLTTRFAPTQARGNETDHDINDAERDASKQ